jgi:hypothetical protein
MTDETKKSLGEALDAVIEALEGLNDQDRAIAMRAAYEHFGITAPFTAEGLVTSTQLDATSIPQLQKQVIDIRTLKEMKNPSSAIEMACVVAYYLENHAPPQEQRMEIKTKDIETYFVQADFPPPKVPKQVLVDAKAAGYFYSAGRGSYKLNPVGHNLVAHSLPRTKAKNLNI